MVVSTWRAVTYIIQPLRRPRGARPGVLPPPEVACLSATPPGFVGAGMWRGRDLRGKKKQNTKNTKKEKERKKQLGLAVPYPLRSAVVGKKRRPKGRGKAERTFRGDRDVLPRSLGCQGVGPTPWAPLPPGLQGARLPQSPKRAAGSGSRRGRAGRVRRECAGTPLHAGAQWAK